MATRISRFPPTSTTSTPSAQHDATVLNPYSYIADPSIRPTTFVTERGELTLPQSSGTPEPGRYENTINPEEDLLKPLESQYKTSPFSAEPQNNSGAPLTGPSLQPPESAGTAEQNFNTSTSAPNNSVQSSGPSPDEDLLQNVPSGDASGSATEELPSPNAETDNPPATSSSNGGKWDKNAPPSDDEDLLQNMSSDSTGQSSTSGSGQTNSKSPATGKTPANKSMGDKSKMNPHASATKSSSGSGLVDGVDPHLDLYSETLFPSAKECRKCHEEIYDEWAGSSHAYAAISPMFHKFEQTIHALTQGTISYFCYRCHAPVATTIGHPREASIFDSVPSAIEGVTCIACHRVDENYGKVNGERRIIPASIYEPVYGSGYGEGLREVLAAKSKYKVKTEPGEKGPGQDIHGKVIHFEQISSSHFCVSCHQVAVVPGIALEVVWAQYRASPACKQGISCQDCHMGIEPGVAAGYDTGPVAIVNDVGISPERKHSNHTFYGPGYSIAHPGVFPFNPKADDWTVREWMSFDYRAGWGTKEFEDALDDEKIPKPAFPEVWEEADDRLDAREIVEENLAKLEAKREMRHRLMENGSHLEGPIFRKAPRSGRPLVFHYDVTNTNSGHNMPSGSLGAQPQLWLNVALTGPNGQHLWESGYVDANGDVADVHSLEVAAGRIRRDLQLFNLQTKFLITGVKGTDREMYLPINTDIDQLPFIRQSGFPITVMNHPPFIRMEGHSIPPLGTRKAKYRIPAKLMKQPGMYRLSVRMRSRAEPIYFMRFCNATPEMERNMNEWMLDYHEQAYEFFVP